MRSLPTPRHAGGVLRTFWVLLAASMLLWAYPGAARPEKRHRVTALDARVEPAAKPYLNPPVPPARKSLQDTVWNAYWPLNLSGSPQTCVFTGWVQEDHRILSDGNLYWAVTNALAGTGGIVGNAASLGYVNNVCRANSNGYANDWYQAIRITYTGAATLSFNYVLDSEQGSDFLRVESDSLCGSFGRVNNASAPGQGAAAYRKVHYSDSGLDFVGTVNSLALPAYGTGTDCVYISFYSDPSNSPSDGLPTVIGRALGIDNISITDGSGTRTENFTDGSLDIGTFVNIQDATPFGTWARTYAHATDNDLYTENQSCSVIWSDHTTPTIANDASMSFGPGGFVIKNWLDDIIVSPWAARAGIPSPVRTFVQFRCFPGNRFATSRIVFNWSIRAKSHVGPTPCVSEWGHASDWMTLDHFGWTTLTFDASRHVAADAESLQVRFRVSDWRVIEGGSGPVPFNPGPGPYLDDIRIGSTIATGPVLNENDAGRAQAQDCFPTEIHPLVTPAGQHHRPTTDRFGTCAFTRGADIGAGGSPNLITGDSITVEVFDARGVGIASVDWYGAIVAGPPVGKAPAPHTVGANGFFHVTADTARTPGGTPVDGIFFVDLDDTYFRGGDVLWYFWMATDSLGGTASDPPGLTAVPATVAAAQAATGGLHEANYLPEVNWAPAYLARIAADLTGDLEPTAQELALSNQANCFLYVARLQSLAAGERSAFMYTLDRLGYRGAYDVYSHSGGGSTSNQLAGRATVEQAQGYNLIVYDAGGLKASGRIMPTGSVPCVFEDQQVVDQAEWFRSWLAQVPTLIPPNFATLWVLGSNVLQDNTMLSLYTGEMAVVFENEDQGLNANPEVTGVASFTFDNGIGSTTVNFTETAPKLLFGLDACWSDIGQPPCTRSSYDDTQNNYDGTRATYDALSASQDGTVVYRYKVPCGTQTGDGAIVMRRHEMQGWNTIFQSHAWDDIRDPCNTTSLPPEQDLLQKILGGVLPQSCLKPVNPSDVPENPGLEALPERTILYPNVPNPFNPVSAIRFDLAAGGRVRLRIFDVAGGLVRTLVDKEMTAGANKRVLWDGEDNAGRQVSSGIYFYRLETSDATLTRKMVNIK